MKYVLDSNVALKWVLKEPDSAKAIRIRDEFRQGIHQLLAPDVFPIEVAHAIARAERRGAIKHGDGLQKLTDVFTYMPGLHPYLPLLPKPSRSPPRPASASMTASTLPWPSGRAVNC
jgi:predicted nucleic acid-binding protein